MMINLFGEEQKIPAKLTLIGESIYMRFKRLNNYRKYEDINKRCKVCTEHLAGEYHNKMLHKCKLIGLSHSEATDIRVNNVCDKFKLMEKKDERDKI